MDRREFVQRSLSCASIAGAGLFGSAAAQAQSSRFEEGKHFIRLGQNLPVTAPAGKIEVVEFFWYGCPHCHAFEPSLEPWVHRLPADVAFRRVHVGFRPAFEPLQRLYVTLESMGKVDLLHRKVFNAIHQQGARLDKPEAVIDFVAANGVDRNEFTALYNSFAVQSKARQGKQLSEGYKIDGVPAIGVHGRFMTSPSMAGQGRPEAEGQAMVLELVDQLIGRVRRGA
jgi:thiol:disulfide interchange protein DsbA